MSSDDVKNFRRFYNNIIGEKNMANARYTLKDSTINLILADSDNKDWLGSTGFLALPSNSALLNGKVIKNNVYLVQYNNFLGTLLRQSLISQTMYDSNLRTLAVKKEKKKKEPEVKEPEVKGPEPQVVDGPAITQAEEKDLFGTNDLTAYLENQEKKNKLQAAINKGVEYADKKRAMEEFKYQGKLFGIAESKRLLAEKKAETKAQARKTIAQKLKQDIKRLKEEAKAEMKAKTRALIGNRRGMSSQDINRAPQEKKSVSRLGISDILRAQEANPPREPTVTSRVAPDFTVIPPLLQASVQTPAPAPAPAPQAEAVLEEPQQAPVQASEAKQRPRPNMAGLLKRQQERKEKRQVKEAMTKMRSAQPRTREQFIAEQEQQFIEAGLDVDADAKQQERENRLEKELEQAQEVQLPINRMTMGQRIAVELGGITFSTLASILFRRAISTGNSELIDYSTIMGGLLGTAVYRSAITNYPEILNTIVKEANNLYQTNPDDIIDEYNKPEPLPEVGPLAPAQPPRQRSVEDIKGEGKIQQPSRVPVLDSKSTPEQIDAFRASQGLPPANRGAFSRLRGMVSARFARAPNMDFRRPEEPVNRQYMGGDPNEMVYLDEDREFDGLDYIPDRVVEAPYRVDEEYATPPSRIREAIERAKRVAKANEKNIITGGSAVAGAGLAGVGIVGGMNKQQPRIKENPVIFKQEQTTQGEGEGVTERGAGKLKPKFIVPSANIFSKTEQEQYVDDMEFAMFDFVQDEGGNDPYGTNPILRDQHLTENLRYQRSGVNVYSLYGANLPDDPRNMPIKKMQELFLGENRLPEMKFLFSNEFEAQEFNQSEFEVDEYDVNNERTAIEAFSPYANFTNNQLLDQFYDTSILYGVCP